jgi:hypothetical protein
MSLSRRASLAKSQASREAEASEEWARPESAGVRGVDVTRVQGGVHAGIALDPDRVQTTPG